MADLTPNQQKIVKRYYDNLESLSIQRLAELVSDLYLTEGKKRQTVWKNIEAALLKLDVAQSRIDTLKAKDDPAAVAELVKELSR
jgi:RNA polymerase-interacting CarD/CdnL/TRCF family regulator